MAGRSEPMLEAPALDDDWCALSTQTLPVGPALDWAVRPHCGAVVTFTGTVRDHAEGRSGVSRLEYEAYDTQVVPVLHDIAVDVRRRWPDIGRIALLHRVGTVDLGAVSVVVVVSAPHRGEAFDAARHAIDTLKHTVPIWKREFWDGQQAWGLGGSVIEPVAVEPVAGQRVESR